MKICVGIPVITGADHCKRAIDSVLNQENVELLIIDNNAESEVKEMLCTYGGVDNFSVIVNKENIYVNAAWNQILEWFIFISDCDRLVIMNSDLVMQHNWANVCRNRWNIFDDEILIPLMLEGTDLLYTVPEEVMDAPVVTVGVPGVFFTLDRRMASIVFSIPPEIRVWFGDNYAFEKLRKAGYKTVIPENLLSIHSWSSSVSVVPGISEIIEQDKIAWETVKHTM